MSNLSRVLKTKGNKITSRFGMRTITYTSGPSAGKTVTKNHNGIDVVGTGNTLDYIIAHTAGTVQAAGYDSTVGYYVQIKTASNVLMVYYHMKAGSLKVLTGAKVAKGQTLGYMGATGNVTGAHLHFGIKVNGTWIDPEPYLNADFGGDTVTVTLSVLKKGSKGAEVKSLQAQLTGFGYDTKGIDGNFGTNTENAVKKYQKANGLTVDGIAGEKTRKSLLGI